MSSFFNYMWETVVGLKSDDLLLKALAGEGIESGTGTGTGTGTGISPSGQLRLRKSLGKGMKGWYGRADQRRQRGDLRLGMLAHELQMTTIGPGSMTPELVIWTRRI